VVGVNVGEDVTRRTQVSTTATVRSGRIVMERLQSFDTASFQGLALTLGSPVPAETWVYPDGVVGAGVEERYVVYNPGSRPAEVELELRVEDPAQAVQPEPFELTVAARGFEVVNVSDDDRMPDDVAHQGVVRSLNGVPVVAERVFFRRDPAPQAGLSVTPGSPMGAEAWVFAAGTANDTFDEVITVANLSGEREARVSVTALVDGQRVVLSGLSRVVVPPGGRQAVRLGEHIQQDELALLIESDEPVVVERSLHRISGLGVSAAIGIPLRVGLYVPRALEG
jgi:hypothetical protein